MNNLPEKYQPLSPWAYFWLQILYNIPIIGIIILILNAIGSNNINRRNFARSYFCVYVIIVILIIIFATTGAFSIIFNLLNK